VSAGMRVADWLGTGWASPVNPDPTAGHLDYTDGPEKVRQALRIILLTEPGERVMRPTFGCALAEFVMQPNTIATRALIEAEVRRAVDTWEPRVEVQAVDVQEGAAPTQVVITIRYEHRTTGRTEALVFPYALEVPR